MFMFDDENSARSSQYYFPDENDCRTCNICVSNCPTFSVDRDLMESPRGRLKLLKKVLEQGESLTPDEQQHLDSCVMCRACESVCPSKMQYGELFELAREKLESQTTSALVRALLYVTSDKARLNQLFATLRTSQQWGMQVLARRLGLFKLSIPEHLDHLLPTIPKPRSFKDYYPAIGERRGAIGLFTGCITYALDNPTLIASINVLTKLGYDVHIPSDQQCCGALHRHIGDSSTANALGATNIQAFNNIPNLKAIIITATGCGEPMLDYGKITLGGIEQKQTQLFSNKIMDINQFIAQQPWPEHLELKPLTNKVLVHEPCSQRFPLGSQPFVYEMLTNIPDIQLEPLAENNLCCGAGASYMLTHPEKSNAIRSTKLKHLKQSQARILVTSNIGCALHLAAGINKEKMEVVVAHPVEILAQQIK